MARIVHLTSVHPAFDTRIFYKECRSLAKAGYVVRLCAPHDKDEVVGGVQIVAVRQEIKRLRRVTLATLSVYQSALQEDADLYHFHDPELIPVGLLLQARGKRVVYDIHEDVPRNLLVRSYLQPAFKRILSWLFERFENFAVKRFSALVVATTTIGERFKGCNPNIETINNYPWSDELYNNQVVPWNERANAAGYVGRITRARGVIEMVQAMEYIDSSLQAHLEIGGRFDTVVLQKQVTQLPGWSHVNYKGFLDRLGTRQLLEQVRVGLVLMHPEPTYIRSQPTKMFEYMSAGIPVIASDFPLWRELIEREKCGLVVNPLDVRAIACAIEHVLTHPREAAEMGERGRKAVVERYNWASQEHKLLALYENVLSVR